MPLLVRFLKRYSTFVCSLLAVVIVAACRGGGERSETNYYSPAALQGRTLPEWNGTNSIPLAPDKAVTSAIQFANSKHSTTIQWELEKISLERATPSSPWYYKVHLLERGGKYRSETVYVLLNGDIWKPSKTVIE
jgi:hypothetical protein